MISKIIATGSYLPKKILTNQDLSKIVDTSDEWIVSRSGIKQRHIAAENEFTSDLAIKAAEDAIKSGNINPDTIDAVIVATVSPDFTFPAVATQVQSRLNLKNSFAFDVEAACAGFLVALSIAEGFIASSIAKRVLIIGAEVFSKFIDWKDRSTCILFGDGAGAAIIEKSLPEDTSGILGLKIKSDGNYGEILKSTGGVVTTQTAGYINMHGSEVFRQAVLKMGEILDDLLNSLHLSKEDIDFLVPHQANIRIINSLQEKFNIPNEKVIKTIHNHANTSAASLILALDFIAKNNIVKKGDLIALNAIGAGLTWGAALIKW